MEVEELRVRMGREADAGDLQTHALNRHQTRRRQFVGVGHEDGLLRGDDHVSVMDFESAGQVRPIDVIAVHFEVGQGCVQRHMLTVFRNHRDVGIDTHTWQRALKNTFRQAPDVILIGEIRDRETMEYGIQFAETGHLVLATLHANSSNQALDRIINFFPEERREQLLMDLSLNIRALISQRLIPREAGTGRIAAMEIMLASPLISDLIFKGEVAKIKDVMSRSNRLGMKTFDQALFELYEQGLISYEDALRNADSKNELRLRVKLESKREMKNPEQGGQSLQIVEEEAGQVF